MRGSKQGLRDHVSLSDPKFPIKLTPIPTETLRLLQNNGPCLHRRASGVTPVICTYCNNEQSDKNSELQLRLK